MNRVGPYEIVGELGRGGMGVVYRARRDDSAQQVALKVIAAGEDATTEQLARFQREVRLARELDHPNIVRVLDAGAAGDVAWFAMELIDGEPLSTAIRGREFSWQEAVTLTRDIADAVAAAHARGILHRDLKPSNILLDSAGKPHVADFGLAKDTRTESKYTRTGATLGTPAYMSPEQARGDLAALTPASDVWSLGCILYELLANRPAFEGDTPAAVIGAVMTVEPPPLPGTPEPLQLLLAHCLQKTRSRRCPDASALRSLCDRLRAGQPLPRIAGGSAGRKVVAGLLGALLLAGGAAAVAIGQGFRGEAANDEGQVALTRRAEELARRAWEGRHADLGAANRGLREALRLAPARDDWRLRLGLLRWAESDSPESAAATWGEVPPASAHYARAKWLTGLAWLVTALEGDPERARGRADAAWEAALTGSGPEVEWARAGLMLASGAAAEARAMLDGADDWSAQLLRGFIEAKVAFPFQQARSRGGEEEYARGLAGMDRALREGLRFPSLLAIRGDLRWGAGRRQDALADYEAALRIRPAFVTALLGRSNYRVESGDRAGARSDLDIAVGTGTKNFAVYANRARLREEDGDLVGAMRDVTKALQYGGVDPGLLLQRARLFEARGELSLAIADLDEAIRRDGTYASAHFNRAVLRTAQGDLSGAVADYSRAIHLNDSHPEAYFNRALAKQDLGDVPGAIADLTAAIARRADYASAYYCRGVLNQRLRDFPGALADYGAAIAHDPAFARAFVNRANLYRVAGDLRAAMADLSAALKVDPTLAEARSNRGFLRLQCGEAAGAAEDFEALQRLAPDNGVGYAGLAQVKLKAGAWREAIPLLRKFLELAPNHRMAPIGRRQLQECEERLAAQGK